MVVPCWFVLFVFGLEISRGYFGLWLWNDDSAISIIKRDNFKWLLKTISVTGSVIPKHSLSILLLIHLCDPYVLSGLVYFEVLFLGTRSNSVVIFFERKMKLKINKLRILVLSSWFWCSLLLHLAHNFHPIAILQWGSKPPHCLCKNS